MKKNIICGLIVLLFGLKLGAQIANTNFAPVKFENYFRFNYDNDFFSATDRYYTQGILIDFVHPVFKYSPVSKGLIKLNNARNYYGLHVQQDVYTPRSIRYKGGSIYYGERPFTAVFFVSHILNSLQGYKKIALQTQIDLGIIGPEAKGEEEQKGIHKALNNIEPQGWDNQLSTDIVINYRVKLEKGIIDKTYFNMNGFANARIGTLFSDVGFGLNSRLGIFSPYFNNLGLERNPNKKLKIYFATSSGIKLVGYNATLQGGLTNTGNIYELPDKSISRLVAEVSGGVVLAYNRLSLEYTKVYITREFKGGVDHGWGKCVITYCF